MNKKIVIYIIILFSIIIIGTGVTLVINSNKKDDKKISKDIDEPYVPNDVELDGFTYSFLKLETNKKNMVYSPLSIKYALFMLNEGASSNTQKEISDLIGDELPTKYENIDNVLSLANSLFIRDSYKKHVLSTYVDTLKEKFNAEVFYDEFKDASNVNNWIEEKTFKIIKNMLKDEQVQNPNLEMILVNALAIDMEWQNKFEEESTTSRPFLREEDEINVAMMHKSSSLPSNMYYQDDKYNALLMPLKKYEDTSLEFIAIMPNSISLDSFLKDDKVEENINNVLNKLHSVNESEELSISIPRFEYEYSLRLKDDLQVLGIKDAFAENADFSNMSDSELQVSDALHKANIKLSEKGIKAGAATVILMTDKASFPEEKEYKYLNFNKPFMYIIRDSKTHECWFVGTVYEPLLWENVKDDYNYR